MASREPALRLAFLSMHSCPRGKLGTRDTGGMQVYVGELARALARRGHVVDIFTRTHPGRHPDIALIAPRVRLVHVPDGIPETPKSLLHNHIDRFQEGVETYRRTSDATYDLIHSHYWLSGLAGLALRYTWRVPHLVTFHTLGQAKNRAGAGPPEGRLRLRSECQVAGASTRIIASTPRELADLEAFCQPHPAPVAIVPCGCNLRLFKPVDRARSRASLGLGEDKLVLSVGRFDPVKGHDLLLRAFARLPGRRTRLLLVGGDVDNSERRNSLEILAGELGVHDRVIFQGAVPQSRLKVYYSAADVCAVSSCYETFSMVALEALACGTPLAATDVGGIRPLLGNPAAGIMAEEMTPNGLAEAIEATLAFKDGPGEREVRRDAVAGYAWEKVAERMVREYQVALTARPDPGRRHEAVAL